MDVSARYDSSAGDLSSPPSHSSPEPGSPSRQADPPRNGSNEIVVKNEQRQGAPQYEKIETVPGEGNAPAKRFGLMDGQWVQLTAAGLPRKKPGRKPGAQVKAKASEGPEQQQPGQPEAKVRKPRKPRDPNALPVQRKRKIAPADSHTAENAGRSPKVLALGAPNAQSPQSSPGPNAKSAQDPNQSVTEQYSPTVPKRQSYPLGSMQSILNAEPSPNSSNTSNGNSMPVRSVGQSYDPIRDGKYDPIRETMVANNPYPSNSGSPRAPTQAAAHRSPSIASLIDPPVRSPNPSQNGQSTSTPQSRLQPFDSPLPGSPSKPSKVTSDIPPTQRATEPESKKEQPLAPPPVPQPVIKESNFATIANGPVKKLTPKEKAQTGTSTPKTDNLDDVTQEGEGRSILDFGRAKPGEEAQAPTIILNIPIQAGETNKYINFMRLAEDRYGWDALHPRLAANRDRKARIAAAAANLEKIESGRESGDEMSVDLSDVEGSNAENGVTSGVDAQAKPKKKRNFKEDNYDIDDDFVDDSELLWEAQAAASRDGFFVYSGPLVSEAQKPPAGQDGPPKRGRGGGRGSRGGRGGASARGGAGTGRGGPGSRGGAVARKPRISKTEKAQREREKVERESLAQLDKNSAGNSLQPKPPSFAVSELGA